MMLALRIGVKLKSHVNTTVFDVQLIGCCHILMVQCSSLYFISLYFMISMLLYDFMYSYSTVVMLHFILYSIWKMHL